MQAYGQKDGGKPILLQAVEGDVFAKGDTGFYLDTHLLDDLNFVGQKVPGKTVLGDSHRHHAAGNGEFFVDGNLVALPGQAIGGSEACGSGSDDGHLFFAGFGHFRYIPITLLPFVVGKKTVQLTDGKGLVHVVTGTDLLAGMVADPAADTGKRMLLLEEFKGFPVLSLVDKGDIALNTHMCGAGGFAWCGAALVDSKGAGNGLGIFFESRLAFREPFVIFVGACNGTYLGTLAAAGALVRVDKAGFLVHFCREITGFSLQLHQFRVGEQFDVEMPADLDQFR